MTELELVRRAKAGDRPAMTELVSAHFAQVHRLALHILRNEPDAEDATQNTFVKALPAYNVLTSNGPSSLGYSALLPASP